jgi:proteic killer suppression protein
MARDGPPSLSGSRALRQTLSVPTAGRQESELLRRRAVNRRRTHRDAQSRHVVRASPRRTRATIRRVHRARLGGEVQSFASRHVTHYTEAVIKTFADRRTQEIYATGKSRRLPAEVAKRAARKLEYVDLATCLDDLRVPPGNRLHALTGNRKGQHSISVNDQWRICFRFADGDAYDVEFCDYH